MIDGTPCNQMMKKQIIATIYVLYNINLPYCFLSKYTTHSFKQLKKELVTYQAEESIYNNQKIKASKERKYEISMYLPPCFSWHCKLEKVTSAADDGASLPWGHWNVERANPYDPLLISNNW
jgi:hypothetical protein